MNVDEKTIDERIVSMEFDNSRFQGNIKDTMQSLDEFDKQIEGMSNDVSSNAEKVSSKLFDLDEIITGFNRKVGEYFAELSRGAANFVKSLSIDPMKAGFSKYTAETLAAQTIVSNAGDKIKEAYDLSSEDEVIKETYNVIGKLAKYTDATSYSYENLNDTMSKFVMSGTDLYDAEQAMEGIGNWAAVTGAGIQKASAVMPTLVKSVNAGYLRLRDWQSVQANNMADPVFVEKLLQHARETNAELVKFERKNGKITYETFTDEKYGVFGNNKFITAQALIDTLKEYGDAESEIGKKGLAAAAEAKTFEEAIGAVKDAVSSGWGQTFRYIFGDYAEARRFFTMVQDMMLDVFTIGTDFRNEVLQIWHTADTGGYKDFVESLEDLWSGVKALAQPIGDAFHDIFGLEDSEKAAKKLQDLTKSFRDATKSFKDFYTKPGEILEVMDAIERGATDKLDESLQERYARYISSPSSLRSFKVLQQVFDSSGPVASARNILTDIKNIFSGIFSVIDTIKTISDSAINLIGRFISELSRLIKPILELGGAIGRFLTSLNNAAKETDFIRRIFNSIWNVINSLLSPAIELATRLIKALADKIGNTQVFETAKTVFDKIATAIEGISTVVSGVLKTAFEWLLQTGEKIIEKLSPLKQLFGDIKEKISDTFGSLIKTQESSSKPTMFDRIVGALGSIANFLADSVLFPLFESFVSLMGSLWTSVQPLGSALETVATSIGKLFKSFNDENGEEKESPLKKLFDAISGIVTFLVDNAVVPLIEGLANVIKQLGDNTTPLGQIFENAWQGIKNFFKGLFGGTGEGDLEKNSESLANIGKFLTTAGEIIGKVAGWLAGILHSVWESLQSEIEKIKGMSFKEILDVIKQILDVIKGIFAGRALFNVGTFAGNLAGITGAIQDFLNGIMGAKKQSSFILDIGKSLLYIAAACLIVAAVPADKLKAATDVINTFINELIGAILAINTTSSYLTISKTSIASPVIGFASNLVDLGFAILLISIALKSLADKNLTKEKLEPPLEALKDLIGILALAEVAMSAKIKTAKGFEWGQGKGPKGLLMFAVVIWAFSKILKDLANNTKPEELQNAADALVKIIAVSSLAIGLISGLQNKFGGSAGINTKVTVAMKTGLLQIALVIGALAALMYVLSKHVVGNDSLVTATACLGGIILAIITLSEVTKKLNVTASQILELYAFIAAIAAMAGILTILSGLNFGSMMGGLLGMVVLMVEMVALAGIAETFSKSFAEMAAGLIGMYAVVGLMAAMAGVLTILSNLDIKNAALGLLELVGAFVVLAGIAIAATVLEPFLATLNGLFAGFAIGLALAAAAALGFALAFKIIVDTLNDGVPKIQERGDSVSSGLITVLDIMIEAVSAFVPKLIELVVSVLVGIIRQIAESAEEIVSSIILLIKNVGESIDKHSDEIGEAVARLLVGILKAVWSFLKNLLFDLLEWFGVSKEEAGNFFSNIWEKITTFVSDTWDKITGFFVDIWNSISEWFTTAINDVGTFFSDIWKSITDWFNDLIKSVVGWFEDIKTKVSDAWNAVLDFFNPKRKENRDAVSNATTTGKNIADGAAKGIRDNSGAVSNAASNMTRNAAKAANYAVEIESPSKLMWRSGRFFDMGFANGINQFAYLAGDAAEGLAENAIDPMNEAIASVSDFDAGLLDEPVIKPILDLSDIQNGIRNVGSMFGNYTIGAGLSGAIGSIKTSSPLATAPIINMTINGAEGQNVEELANIISNKINLQLRSYNSVWA